jgi:ferredoxin
MCPLSEKAIRLDPAEPSVEETHSSAELLRPVVIDQRCIGCGICENKCPIEGEAAIRIVHVDVRQEGGSGNGPGRAEGLRKGANRSGANH